MLTRLAELPLLVILLGLSGLIAFVPALYALGADDYENARDFLYSGLILLVVTVMLGIATAAYSPRDLATSHLAALALAYAVLPLALALPLAEALADTTLVNAWFEMTSAFTTTGASVYAPQRLADAIHLWRATVGWFGGFLTLLAAYAILAPLNLGGNEVISGRTPGRGAKGAAQVTRIADPTQRLTRFALTLFPVYLALTVLLWCALLILGETGISALIHAMGTLSTSGISGQTAFQASGAGVPGELAVFAFLIFAVTRRAFPGIRLSENRRPLLQDPELRLAALLLSAVALVLFFRHWVYVGEAGAPSVLDALNALWGILFTAASFLTTTGYISSDWQTAAEWSGIGTPGLVLMGLAIVGGGTATTAGGVKLLRVHALLRHGERELERIVHPNSIGHGGPDARRLRREGAQLAWVFFMLFATSIAVVMACLLLAGVKFEPAMVLAIASLTTTGPLAEIGAAQPIAYATLSDPVKLILGFAMVLGRLETLALLALILPGTDRR
ncbi:TrkH family potassium uptake protein [Rhodobacter calidifons]|uniref:TrkH family potassium uptake protein n=1 Tax=Rhodobacter calidifons TaxID=2715277 RepID=UPI001A99887C|nr:TrkH family potassium uptake protein [Rhodobacter calidifons]